MAEVVSVCISQRKGTRKHPVPAIQVRRDHGIVGDAHAGSWHRQISLLAQESGAELLTPEALPEGFEVIPLPGHFFHMTGYRTPDGVVYLADCLSSRETLEKYQIGFIYDVAAYLDTLDKVKNLSARMFVPAHAPASEEIASLAQYNQDKVWEIAERIVDLCGDPLPFETILQRLFTAYQLTMNFEQYVLVGSTVRSYLSWLKDAGRLNAVFSDNLLLWERA